MEISFCFDKNSFISVASCCRAREGYHMLMQLTLQFLTESVPWSAGIFLLKAALGPSLLEIERKNAAQQELLKSFLFSVEFNKTLKENEVSFSFFIKRQRVKDVINAIGFVFGFYCSLIQLKSVFVVLNRVNLIRVNMLFPH